MIMEESEIAIDVQASHLSKQMQQKLNSLWGKPNEKENFTIFRTPSNICQSKKNLFEPFVVSIGPFHHGRKSLRMMEEKKWRFLRDILSRGDHISLDLCISEMKLLEERTRLCYSETVDLDSDGFVEMMLLDGCFLIEYFSRGYEGRFSSILEVGWNSAFILSDLLLLENQLPFFVVEKLCEISIPQKDGTRFFDNLAAIMARQPTGSSQIPNHLSVIHHLLHLCYHCSVPNNPEKPVALSSKFLSWLLRRNFPRSNSTSLSQAKIFAMEHNSTMVIPCAGKLQDAGVKFRCKSNPCHMLDISFNHSVLEIPRITITHDTKPLLMNLLAFEQCNLSEMEPLVTSFACFLESLINTEKDVMILQQYGIIENCLSSEDGLTDFFNQLCVGATVVEDHFLAELFMELNRYCHSSWRRLQSKLTRGNCHRLWPAISLMIAVLLLFTSVQAFFAVYAYFRPPS